MVSAKHEQQPYNLGSNLRALREEHGLTREQLSERAEIGIRYLAAIELGEKTPSTNILIRLLRSMGAPADRIVYPEQYVGDNDLARISRLTATCSSKQRKMIIAFIEMILSDENFT